MTHSAHITQAHELLESLKVYTDRYHRECPRQPDAPREPRPTLSAWETLSESDYSDRHLSELVNEALTRAGIDPEQVPANMRAAFDSTLVTAFRISDDPPSLRLEWETVAPNPQYNEARAVYLTEMMAYEAACEAYLQKVKAYVAKCNTTRMLATEAEERATYERLQKKFGKKG